jgi:hypothetical protein
MNSNWWGLVTKLLSKMCCETLFSEFKGTLKKIEHISAPRDILDASKKQENLETNALYGK